jgi:hypothetical protein
MKIRITLLLCKIPVHRKRKRNAQLKTRFEIFNAQLKTRFEIFNELNPRA